MIDDSFRIYVEQLRDGHVEKISESLSPDFLDIQEKDLVFRDPVKVQGEAYLADDEFVLHLDVETTGIIPCKICNEPVKTDIVIKGFYHAVPIKEVKGGIFNFSEVLRETILLEVPSFVECNQGKCSKRQSVKQYLKDESKTGGKKESEEGYRPFANLDFDQDTLK